MRSDQGDDDSNRCSGGLPTELEYRNIQPGVEMILRFLEMNQGDIEPVDRDEQEENKPTEELASTKEAVEEMVATKKTKTQEVQEERKDVKGCEVEGETQAKDRKGQQGNREKRTRGDELKEKLAKDEEMSIPAYRLILGHYWVNNLCNMNLKRIKQYRRHTDAHFLFQPQNRK